MTPSRLIGPGLQEQLEFRNQDIGVDSSPTGVLEMSMIERRLFSAVRSCHGNHDGPLVEMLTADKQSIHALSGNSLEKYVEWLGDGQ